MKNHIVKTAFAGMMIIHPFHRAYSQEIYAQSGPNIQALCTTQLTFEPLYEFGQESQFFHLPARYTPGVGCFT